MEKVDYEQTAPLNLLGRPVLVLGGTDEASEKVPKLLAAGARVTIVATHVSDALAKLARSRAVTWPRS